METASGLVKRFTQQVGASGHFLTRSDITATCRLRAMISMVGSVQIRQGKLVLTTQSDSFYVLYLHTFRATMKTAIPFFP